MSNLNSHTFWHIMLYEWKHFVRSPFKVVAVMFFVFAAVYGLHNGAALYENQKAEIGRINQKTTEQRQKILDYYEKGETGPPDRPWVDVTTPFWAVWNTPTYHFKKPSPAMVYSIGQAGQYGFYKQISFWSSPYDADMAEEIANPERLQSGTLDFSFAMLFLMPLLVLILLYNLKGAESDQGFLPLIYVQTASGTAWLVARVAFYGGLLWLLTLALLIYGALLTGVTAGASNVFGEFLLYLTLYLLLWLLLAFFILQQGKSSVINTLQLLGLWLFFAFILPATVHQWVSTTKPANLMTDLIDVQRDGREKIFTQPDSVIDAQLFALFPTIQDGKLAQDSTKRVMLRNYSASGLANDLVMKSTRAVVQESHEKNRLIRKTYWYNPVTFFQNKLNALSQTHFDDYETYRQSIQQLVDKRINMMVTDLWNGVTVDKEKYLEYNQNLSSIE